MKKILIIIAVLLAAILVVIAFGVWRFFGDADMLPSTSTAPSDETVVSERGNVATTSSAEEGIPLPQNALTPEQRALAESLGIDVDSFVITETMIQCVEGKFGKARLDEIMAGASPSPLEAMRMLPCIE